MSALTFSRVCLLDRSLELVAVQMVGQSLRTVSMLYWSFLFPVYLSTKQQQHIVLGFAQVVRHPWFDGFDWDNLANIEGPLLPTGAKDFPRVIEYLKTCPKTDPNFKQLVAFATQNFDTFEDQGSALDSGGKSWF